VAGGMHGANRLGGNSLSDLLVFGQRAGAAAAVAARTNGTGPAPSQDQVERALAELEAPLLAMGGEEPNRIHEDLRSTMQDLVGIFRTAEDLDAALERITDLRRRWSDVSVDGPRSFNHGWDLVFELRNMLVVSEAIARSAQIRTESRGAHSRLDHPSTDPEWEHRNVVVSADGAEMRVGTAPTIAIQEEQRMLVAKV
jgi:succinate dehydrogenase / fumarate reductase flavoprotein subunit